ncbi:hypothetical protein EDD18DRAFT_1112175 [Armillaria luteobubalina]|uniref:Uncharacterized protein n=1 Tax=Armillaria luteobubalina TaxID=153913 RepID=A0AA39UEP2_9AGAR|nr:hypothetical protein EDD18DRAFT_1112175 [Armillaria luteobubalina]
MSIYIIKTSNKSTFLDLEAGVSCDDEVDSPYEDSDENFITEEDSADSTTESMAFDRATALMVDNKSQAWMSFLERTRSGANDLKSSLETECGWEESVVLHIGQCAQPELGIKAAFITLLMKEMKPASSASHHLSRRQPACIGKQCNKSIYARLLGNSLSWTFTRWRIAVGSQPEPNLFDPAALEQTGHHVVKEEQSSHYFWRSTYDHDLLVCWIYFSQLDIANEIPQKLADLFAQSAHPLVHRNIGNLPRVSEWCFQVSEAITDISRHISRTINGIDCKKEFEIGTYIEITGEEHATRWSGWIHGIDDGLLHLISCSSPENEQIEICRVHPNCVSMIALPHIASIQQDDHSQHQGNTMSIVPWKGVMVQVIKPGHHWHGKTGYVVDVNITMDQWRNKEILQIFVQLSHYDPNTPFVSLWFGYHNIIDEESWLPLNEAHLLVKDTDFFHHVIPVTNVLGKRGRRLPPEPVAPPQSVTPQLDPMEQCLSPAWNPSVPDPPPIQYWCLNHWLLNSRFRMQYNNLKITALVHYDLTLHEIVCIRDDTPL